jgi:catechol 2,3-dioxygenase-like lactoylglutathione lyase family enzyme
MKISSISGVVYPVADLDRTSEFYEQLGFRLGKREDTRLTCYVNWFWLTFTVEPDRVPAAGEPTATLYLKVDDLDDYYGAVLAQGLTPSTEPRKDRSGRREFRLLDPDGHQLAFFSK